MIYRWKSKKASAFAKYPSIVVTSHDDPKLKEERLWSPQDHSKKIRQGTKSISRVERENKVRSYWFPKRDIKHFLPPITGEYQQPSLSKVRNSFSTRRVEGVLIVKYISGEWWVTFSINGQEVNLMRSFPDKVIILRLKSNFQLLTQKLFNFLGEVK